MAGMPPIRCISCRYNIGRYYAPLNKLKAHIRKHPEDMKWWTITLDKLELCMMCRTSIISYYDEFDGHLVMANGRMMNIPFHDPEHDSVGALPALVTKLTGATLDKPLDPKTIPGVGQGVKNKLPK